MPWTVWEISIYIVCPLSLLISIQALQIFWIIILCFVICCVFILAKNKVRYTDIIQLFRQRSILRRILCCNRTHYIVESVLCYHRIGIYHSKKVVVKLLFKTKVGSPSLDIIQIQVSLSSIECHLCIMSNQRTCRIITCSYFFAIKVHLCNTDTSIRRNCSRLDNYSYISPLIIIESSCNRMCYSLPVIKGKYHILSVNPETKSILYARNQLCIIFCYILLHQSELNRHSILLYSSIIKWAIMELSFSIFCNS